MLLPSQGGVHIFSFFEMYVEKYKLMNVSVRYILCNNGDNGDDNENNSDDG